MYENVFENNKNNICYNFKKADFPSLYEAIINMNWDLFNENNVNCALKIFYQKLHHLFDSHIPLYNNKKRNYPSWYTSEIITNIKIKAKMHHKFKTTKSAQYRAEFARLRSLIKQQINDAFQDYVNRAQSSITSDPKFLWSYIHNKNRTSRIPGKMYYGNNHSDKPQAIVDMFASFFSTTYTNSVTNTEGLSEHVSNLNSHIFLENITESDIIEATKKLKNKMTSGPDNVPSFIVKDCIRILANPLATIYNLILKTGIFPDAWKEAKVCPIFKSGERNRVENYRAIAIISNFAKVFEIIVYNQIYPLVRRQISTTQHGFMQNRSTVSNLLLFTQYMSEMLDNGEQVDVLYTDFTKAFDRVNIQVLLSKLIGFGFAEKAVELVKSYLTGRHQYVSYNGFKSEWYYPTSGVPQGSNLGPLLFLLFINDLSDTVSMKSLMFADDFKMFSTVTDITDCVSFQLQIEKILQWCKKNALDLNINKCKIVTFTRKLHPVNYRYTIDNTEITRVDTIKDLGVTFDAKLSFSTHINNIVADASRAFGFIIRNCRDFSNITTLKTLYFSYVRSKVEYASIIWSPYYSCHKSTLERVQRKFLKYLYFKEVGFYPPRGNDNNFYTYMFNLHSLEERRHFASVSFLHKLLQNKVDSPELLLLINIVVPRLNLRNNELFYCQKSKTNIMLYSPLNVICRNANLVARHCDIFICNPRTLRATCNSVKFI